MWRFRSEWTASFIAAAVAFAAAATGPDAEPPSKKSPEAIAKPANETKPKEKLTCTTEPVTGSLRARRVCVTQKQIDAQRQAVEDLNRDRRETGGTHVAQGERPAVELSGR
jgi:hypothetical protein